MRRGKRAEMRRVAQAASDTNNNNILHSSALAILFKNNKDALHFCDSVMRGKAGVDHYG